MALIKEIMHYWGYSFTQAYLLVKQFNLLGEEADLKVLLSNKDATHFLN